MAACVWLNDTVAPLLIWLLAEVTVAVRVTEAFAAGLAGLDVTLVTVLSIGSSNGLAKAWVSAGGGVLDEDHTVGRQVALCRCSGSC